MVRVAGFARVGLKKYRGGTMGKQTTGLMEGVTAVMKEIRSGYPKCEKLTYEFRDCLAEFLDMPLRSDRRKTQYEVMKVRSMSLLPAANNLIERIRVAALCLDLLDQYVQGKVQQPNLKRKSVPAALKLIQNTRPELARMQRICNPIPQYVNDTLEHCKQG
jgi:hypothetical protein